MIRSFKSKLRSWWNTVQFPVATHDQVSGGGRWSRRQETAAMVALVLACFAVLLPNLSYPLIEPDETRYAQIALEMNASGDWITPRLDGQPYLDKPPLLYWMTATSFAVFGNHETAARLPSVIAAFATILLTFLLGRRIIGSRAAWLGSMALLMCGGFVVAGRFLILDALLGFFVTACLLTGYIAVREQRHRWVWWMLSGAACALGVLTKGPIALVLCAPPLVASGWLRRDQTQIRLLHWVAFVVPMGLVCIPWYVAVWQSNPEFGGYFFLEHNLKRFTQGSNHQQPFWFYLPVIFIGMFPASLLLPSLGFFLAGGSQSKRSLRSKDLGFLLCASVWIVAFFSIASCKLPTYILPAIPMLCLMLGGMLDHTVFKPSLPNGITAYLKPFPQRATLILIACCLAIISVDVWFRESFETTTLLASVGCLAVGIITLAAWNRDIAFSSSGWAFTAIVAIAILGFTAGGFIPTAATDRSKYVKTAAILAQQPNADVVFFGKHPHGISFQLPGKAVAYFPKEQEQEFVAFVAAHQQMILVTGEESIAATRLAVSQTHELVPTQHDEDIFIARQIEQPTSRIADLPAGEQR